MQVIRGMVANFVFENGNKPELWRRVIDELQGEVRVFRKVANASHSAPLRARVKTLRQDRTRRARRCRERDKK